MSPARAVEIVEVAPRDGLQNESAALTTADKAALIGLAAGAGARRIEATSFVNQRRVPQMADADALMAALVRPPGVFLSALALNERGCERALAARCDEITFVVVATETFSRANSGGSVAEALAGWRRVARIAEAAGVRTTAMIAAAFGCPFEGEVAVDRVLTLAAAILESGPYELAFADTIGCGVPPQVEALLGGARALAPGVRLRCHFHNTRNTAVANAVAAVAAGVDALDAALGGFGGCPFAPAATGNVATEDLAYALGRMGVSTGIDAAKAISAAHWLAEKLGRPVQSAVARAGLFPKQET